MADVNNKDKIEAVADSAGLWVNVADSAYSAIRVAIVSGGGGGGGAALTAGVSTMGNTLGNTGTVSNQIIFAGINGITLSQSTNAGGATVTISGGGAGGAGFSGGVSTGGNTSGSTGTVSGQIVFVGTNGITLSQSTNGGSATITVSGITQSNQPAVNAFGVSNTGNTAGNTGTSSGITWVMAASNAMTLSQSTAGGGPNTVWVQGPRSATTISGVQSANSIGTRGSAFALEDHFHQGLAQFQISGNTSNTSNTVAGSLVLAGGNNITLSQVSAAGAATVTISAAAQTNQQMTMFATGNTTQSSTNTTNASSLIFAGSGIASVGLSGGSILVSASQSNQAFSAAGGSSAFQTLTFGDTNSVSWTNTNGSIGVASIKLQMFAVSNTTQSSSGTANHTALSFAGAGVASVGVTGGTVVVSVPAGGGAGDGGVFAGVSTGGNTAGSTGTVSTGNFVFVGSNNITLSQSTGAAGSAATMTILGPTLFSGGVSTGGDTAGSTGTVSNQIVFVGSNGITLSQSTGAAGSDATITINGPQATLNYFAPWPAIGHTQLAIQNASLKFAPIQVQNFVTATVLRHFGAIALTSSSNSSWGGTISIHYGIYTKNVSTLSLASSGSVSYAFTNTSNNSTSVLSGQRNFSVPINLSMTPGDYWAGFVVRTSSVNANSWAMSNGQLTVGNSNFSGDFMVATNATKQRQLGLGIYSVSVSTLPNSVAFSELSGTGQSSQYLQVFCFGTL